MAELMTRDSALDGASAVVVAPEAAPQQPGAYGTGWIRDWPDFRDYTPETPVVQAMLADGLVDELHLCVYPITMGGGTRLFADGAPSVRFSLPVCESYENGVAYMNYRTVTSDR